MCLSLWGTFYKFWYSYRWDFIGDFITIFGQNYLSHDQGHGNYEHKCVSKTKKKKKQKQKQKQRKKNLSVNLLTIRFIQIKKRAQDSQ